MVAIDEVFMTRDQNVLVSGLVRANQNIDWLESNEKYANVFFNASQICQHSLQGWAFTNFLTIQNPMPTVAPKWHS